MRERERVKERGREGESESERRRAVAWSTARRVRGVCLVSVCWCVFCARGVALGLNALCFRSTIPKGRDLLVAPLTRPQPLCVAGPRSRTHCSPQACWETYAVPAGDVRPNLADHLSRGFPAVLTRAVQTHARSGLKVPRRLHDPFKSLPTGLSVSLLIRLFTPLGWHPTTKIQVTSSTLHRDDNFSGWRKQP